jgi:hypothetical protein
MELEQRIIIRFRYREHAEPRDIHAQLSAQFDDTAYSLQSVQRWCQSLRQGLELLDDEPRSGRAPIDFSDLQIIFSLEKHPFHSASALAEILDVSHTTILTHLRDPLGMKLFHLLWTPDQLKEQLRASRVQKCQELLPLLEKRGANEFRNILAGDESWLMPEYPDAVKWSLSREGVSERVRQQIGTKKLCSLLFGE